MAPTTASESTAETTTSPKVEYRSSADYSKPSTASRTFRNTRRLYNRGSKIANILGIPDLNQDYANGELGSSDANDDESDVENDTGGYHDSLSHSKAKSKSNGEIQNEAEGGAAVASSQSKNASKTADVTCTTEEKTSTVHTADMVKHSKVESNEKAGIEIRVSTNDISEDGNERSRSPPSKASKLARHTSKIAQAVVWTIMVTFPLLFITLGIVTAVATGSQSDSDLGMGITQANKTAVSLWPIVFAAIAAQTLKTYATFKVERGIKMMTLEQLISSHSVASSLRQPFMLQRLNWISLALLALWSLSPLAGQALLRMSYLGPNGDISDVSLQYLNTTVAPVAFEGGAALSSFAPSVNALFEASVIAPAKAQQAAMDNWDNVKIPVLSSLPGSDDSGWSVVQKDSNMSYSSLLGIPIQGLDEDGGNSSFVITSSYMDLSCQDVANMTLTDFNSSALSMNISIGSDVGSTVWTGLYPPGAEQPGRLIYAAKVPDVDDSYACTQCSFSTVFVDSQIECAGSQCAVTKMKSSSDLFTPISPINYLNWMIGFRYVGGPPAGTAGQSGIYPSYARYIYDPATVGADSFDNDPNLLTISTEELTTRLAVMINTHWLAGMAPYDMTGYTLNGTDVAVLLPTTAMMTGTDLVYHTNWGWLALLLASSVLLLVGGVIGAVCDAYTVGPDIFGFASSLAHRNKYMKVPTGEGTMSGPARARMLRDVTVMVQDVRPDAEVGKIALGTVDGVGQRLVSGRLYV